MRQLRPAGLLVTALLTAALAAALTALPIAQTQAGATDAVAGHVADGRSSYEQLTQRYRSLAKEYGWTEESLYAYPDDPALAIRAWRTRQRGAALWIIAGIHGEEPAGPNAIANNLATLVRLAEAGVPIVLIPLSNPRAYRNNWRYPNTPERDWRKGGYSVGDAEYLLPDLAQGSQPRAAAPAGPETQALTQYVLQLAESYPPRLVLDLHEDELSTTGGYIYSQGTRPDDNPVGAEVIRLLASTGIPIRREGRTRFGEPIVNGVIGRDDAGGPIRDGSIDELLAAPVVLVNGEQRPGPSAATVIVVETPAFAGSQFALRVAAQGAVVQHAPQLWRLGAATE